MADVPVKAEPEGWALTPGDMRIMPLLPNPDALIHEYAGKIEDIIERGTDGDFTWLGLLSEFTMKIQGRI